MKKILAIILGSALLISCNKKSDVSQYYINGIWEGGANKIVYLKTPINDAEFVAFDSAVVKQDNLFEIKNNLDAERVCVFTADTAMKYIMLSTDTVPLRVFSGEKKINIFSDKKLPALLIETVGTPRQQSSLDMVNDFMQTASMMNMLADLGVGLSQKNKDTDPEKYAQSLKNRDTIKFAIQSRIVQIVDSLPDRYATIKLIENGLLEDHDLTIEKVSFAEKQFAKLSSDLQNSKMGRDLQNKFSNRKKTCIGAVPDDFELPTPDGDKISLHSLRGKVVLLDFWASWCGPCVREIPNVRNVYEKYHDKGFEVLSVSMDSKEKAWKDAIKKHNMPWLHVSSLKGNSVCPVGDYFGTSSGIPLMFLLDKDGKIIGRGEEIRGEEMEPAVAKALGISK